MEINKDYKIRKINETDVLSLHNVYFLTWLDTYPNKELNIISEDIVYKFKQRLKPKGVKEAREKIAQTTEIELKILLEHKGKVVALCNAVKNKDYNQLLAIYVLPEYQGLGFGTALWNEVEKFFNPNNKVIVHVVSYNKKAIEFYKKKGFKDTGKIFTDKRFKMRNGAMIPELEMIKEV